MQRLRRERTEEALWDCVTAYQDFEFHTYSGLPYSYHMKLRQKRHLYKRALDQPQEKKAKVLSGAPSGVHIRK